MAYKLGWMRLGWDTRSASPLLNKLIFSTTQVRASVRARVRASAPWQHLLCARWGRFGRRPSTRTVAGHSARSQDNTARSHSRPRPRPRPHRHHHQAAVGGRMRLFISGGAPLPKYAGTFMSVAMCVPVLQVRCCMSARVRVCACCSDCWIMRLCCGAGLHLLPSRGAPRACVQPPCTLAHLHTCTCLLCHAGLRPDRVVWRHHRPVSCCCRCTAALLVALLRPPACCGGSPMIQPLPARGPACLTTL
jgi:hypothetical protein